MRVSHLDNVISRNRALDELEEETGWRVARRAGDQETKGSSTDQKKKKRRRNFAKELREMIQPRTSEYSHPSEADASGGSKRCCQEICQVVEMSTVQRARITWSYTINDGTLSTTHLQHYDWMRHESGA